MLETAVKHQFHLDSCQMSLNVMDYHFRSFTHQVVPKLVEQGIAVLVMETMGSGIILNSGKITPIECLHYALLPEGLWFGPSSGPSPLVSVFTG
jgi:hypothetical protein